MMKSVRGVSIALFALLTAASVCLAQGEPTPPDTSSQATPPAEARKYGLPGQASLGGGAGLSRFMADGDYVKTRDGGGEGRDLWGTRDAAMRFALAAQIRYTMSKRFRWQVSPGFVWTGYKDNAPAPFKTDYFPDDSLKGKYLTLVMPAHAQIQYLLHGKSWLTHVGAGGGLYRVWVEQDRHIVKDPVTKKLHRGFYPGVTAEIGAERFLKSLQSVSLEWTLASHYILATREEQFPSGWNSSIWTTELRFGANYYFDPSVPRKSGTKK